MKKYYMAFAVAILVGVSFQNCGEMTAQEKAEISAAALTGGLSEAANQTLANTNGDNQTYNSLAGQSVSLSELQINSLDGKRTCLHNYSDKSLKGILLNTSYAGIRVEIWDMTGACCNLINNYRDNAGKFPISFRVRVSGQLNCKYVSTQQSLPRVVCSDDQAMVCEAM